MMGYRTLGYCFLNLFLVFLMIFLLLPTGTVKANSGTVNHDSGIITTAGKNIEEESLDSSANTLDVLFSSNVGNSKELSTDNSTISKDSSNATVPSEPLTSNIEPVNTIVQFDDEIQLTSRNGKIKLSIPQGAVEDTIDVELQEKVPGTMAPNKLKFFDLNAYSLDYSLKNKSSASENVTSEPER
jgi:hypothetical protein